jgi:hypothetical protein
MTRHCFFATALGLVMALGSHSSAQVSKTIAINFGADEPNGAGSAVDLLNGPAGASGTFVWNNTTGASGAASGLLEGNTAETLGATVEWQSANTWASQGRGEENNTAPAGNDRNLMTGYLDTSDVSTTTVTVSGLEYTEPYSVLVYIKGGVNGRSGDYTIGDQTIRHTDSFPFSGTYVFSEMDGVQTGDFIVFSGVTGDSFTLSAKAAADIGGFRAPINGIEISGIVGIPEPTTFSLAACCLLGVAGGLRRRMRQS